MVQPPEHIDPLASMFEQFAERAADKLEERLRPLIEVQRAGLLQEAGIDLIKAYSPQEVAELLGTNRIESVYAIPADELPRVRRIGSRIGYLGINVLCYMHGMPPVDMEAVLESYRERLMKEAPNVLALKPEKPGLTRVM